MNTKTLQPPTYKMMEDAIQQPVVILSHDIVTSGGGELRPHVCLMPLRYSRTEPKNCRNRTLDSNPTQKKRTIKILK